MLRPFILALALCGAGDPDETPARDPGATAQTAVPARDPAEVLARYNELREKTPETASAQWKLAVWCEENGLNAEAGVHFIAVARLDPNREAAWKKIGYKRHNGRWMSEEQIADEAAQKRADKLWAVSLKKLHRDVHRGPRQAQACEAVSAIEEPRAIPSVYREFGAGGGKDQEIAIQIFGQINTPSASKMLAILAVYGRTPEVRRRAAESLRARAPEEYLGLLVNMMIDPLRYEVKSVPGPGSTGILLVEGKRLQVKRIYSAPAPNLQIKPGDVITYDALGMPIVSRRGPRVGSGPSSVKGMETDLYLQVQFSASEMMVEAQKLAVSAQLQLQNDVGIIEEVNETRRRFNDLVMNVAKDASGKDLGRTPKDWRAALGPKNKYGQKVEKKPIIEELVPLAYLPQFGHMSFLRQLAPKDP